MNTSTLGLIALALATVLLVVVLQGCPPTRNPPPVQGSVLADVANRGLDRLRGYVQGGNGLTLGFQTDTALNRAVVMEPPIFDYMITIDTLRTFDSGDVPDALLGTPVRVYVPVKVDTTIVSSLLFDCWDSLGVRYYKLIGFGNRKLVTAMVYGRERFVANQSVQIDSVFIVEIPTFNLFYVGGRRSGTLKVEPLYDDSRAEFPAVNNDTAAAKFLPIADAARVTVIDSTER